MEDQFLKSIQTNFEAANFPANKKVEELINKTAEKSKFQRELNSENKEQIQSPEGEKFIIDRIIQKDDPPN